MQADDVLEPGLEKASYPFDGPGFVGGRYELRRPYDGAGAVAVVLDAKLARAEKPTYVLQICFYSDAVAAIQGAPPELDKLAAAAQNEWLVVKVNSDAVPDLAERFGIRSIPTLAIFQGGREIDRIAGARSAEDIRALVSARLAVNSAA